ncbi:MAG: 30S ribosomal protein S3, partial [Rikenellaceae bacterium]
IVGNNIARQIEGRVSYRRAIKMTIASTMRMGAEGIKVQVSGRVGGAEMARSETYKEGRIPLHTFRADIDYSLTEALTKVGILGVKVWICNGEVYDKRDLSPIAEMNAVNAKNNSRPMPAPASKARKGGNNNNKKKPVRQ